MDRNLRAGQLTMASLKLKGRLITALACMRIEPHEGVNITDRTGQDLLHERILARYLHASALVYKIFAEDYLALVTSREIAV